MFFFFFFALILQSVTAQTLRQAAQGKHLFVGSAANYYHLQQDNAYKTMLTNQYNLVTPENACKWATIEPNQRGVFDFTQCDYIVSYAKSASSAFRGHNLCWGVYNPGWLDNGGFSPAEKEAILKNHITTVVTRYGNAPIAWDVVNEAVVDSGSAVFKNNVWYPDIPNYVDIAFQTARAAHPSVKLFYNDYNIASSTGWSSGKSQKVYDMIKSMKQRGIPIDGIGIQLHVDITYLPMVDGVKQNLQRLADLGLEIHMTEIDIACAPYGQSCSGWDAAKEAQQAQIYEALLQACLEQPKCTNFETWGFTDKYTWLGSNEYPLPFDVNLNPKPAFNGLLQTLRNGTQLLRY